MNDDWNLARLDLIQLRQLIDTLDALRVAGHTLVRQGGAPVFDLTPGGEITIRTGIDMPHVPPPWHLRIDGVSGPDAVSASVEPEPEPEPEPTWSDGGILPPGTTLRNVHGRILIVDPLPEPAPDDEAGEEASAENPPPEAVSEDTPAVTHPAAGVHSMPLVEVAVALVPDMAPSGLYAPTPGGQTLPDPATDPTHSAAVDAPPAAEPPAAGGAARTWSDDEDRRVVEVAAEALARGESKVQAFRLAAEAVGRTPNATQFRLYTTLKNPLAAAIKHHAALTPDPSPPPAAQAQQAVEPAPAAVSAPPGPETTGECVDCGDGPCTMNCGPVAAPPLDPLEAHLLSLKPSRVWSPARDLTLMQLAIDGWKPHEIAEDLGVVMAEVNSRFDLLTGYDRATKQRRFKREDVLCALQAMHLTGAA